MMDSGAPLALYAVIGAALLGSVLGVFIERWLVALLAPLPVIVIPMGVLLYLRPYIERHPLLADRTRAFLLELADPATALQMTIASAGGALLGYILVIATRAGQSTVRTPLEHRPAGIRKRVAAVAERTPLQARTERLAAAPRPAAAAPAPVYEVAPALAGSIKVSSVAESDRQMHPPAPDQAERRRRGRRRAILSGFLVLDDGRSSSCRIVDISDSGARVKLPTMLPLPPKLWLINASDWLAYEAALAWRSETEAGLRFLSTRNLKEPVTARDKALHALCAHLTAR
jgi:hypothetical protein